MLVYKYRIWSSTLDDSEASRSCMMDIKEHINKHGYISGECDYGISEQAAELEYIFGMLMPAQRNYGRFDEAYEEDIKDLEKNWENIQLMGY